MPKRFIPHDTYARKARESGYLARSAFKLEAIIARFGVVRPGCRVLDIGAAPGSWLQVVSRIIGPSGVAVGVDISPIAFAADNVRTFTCDILTVQFFDLIKPFSPFDTVLSDAAPRTSGIRDRDKALSHELAERAVETAAAHLKPGGALVVKVFESSDTPILMRRVKKQFRTARTFKPPSSRDRSYETYLIALSKGVASAS